VRRRGITLRADCRELKNTLGLDTISRTKGGAISERAKKRTTVSPALYASKNADGRQAGSAAARAVASVTVHAEDAKGRWWDLLETPEDKDRHVSAMVRLVRMAPHKTLIIVGHSLAMRQMMKTYGAANLDPRFRSHKLSNCGCMAVDFDFGYAEGTEGADADGAAGGPRASLVAAADDGCKPIRAAKLIFGSTFKD